MIKKVPFKGLFRVTRSYNLLIIWITQYLVYLFLVGKGFASLEMALQPLIFVLALSTITIAAAGYIINDYHDVKIDMINKPSRVVVGSIINRRIALVLYFSLSIIGVGLGFMLSWKIGLLNLFSAGWLWLYSVYFKRIAFWGNFSIAMLTALSIMLIYLLKPNAGGESLLAYAWFAFIITLIREIIKDMEDIRGDKAYGCKTLPIIWGIADTAKLIQVLNILMIISLLFAFLYTTDFILRGFAAAIILQVVYLGYQLKETDTISGFRKLGRYCKLIMLTGILALFFF